MKIIISSKTLANLLNKIDFENENVLQVRGEGSNFIINTNKQTLELWVEMIKFEPRLKQENARWDWVKNLVNQIDDQPIVIGLSENSVQIIITY